MPPELLEWGPAHLRDEAQATGALLDVELTDRPDDN